MPNVITETIPYKMLNVSYDRTQFQNMLNTVREFTPYKMLNVIREFIKNKLLE